MTALAELCADLSRVFPSERTRRAADRFLSLADPAQALARSFRYLVWQRTLGIALGHLSAAGADLDALAIPTATYAAAFPRGYRSPWPALPADAPVTARVLHDLLRRHKRLLAEPVAYLCGDGVDRFALVSGRAYEVRYPHYVERAEFDTDLVAPDMEGATAIAASLRRHGFDLDTIAVRRLGRDPDAVVGLRARVEGHVVSVGILVGGYHRLRGDIAGRAELLAWRAGKVPVARPEDLLVMLAARAHRKSQFALVNVNDAAVILDGDAGAVDWDSVASGALAAGLAPTLAVLLDRADRLLPAPLAPPEVVRRLTAGTRHRTGASLAGAVAEADLRLPESSAGTGRDRRRPQRRPDATAVLTRTEKARKRVWLALTASTGLGKLRIAAAIRLQRHVLRYQMRRARSPAPRNWTDGALVRLRTRCGTLCEVSPSLAGGAGCLGTLGAWKGPDTVADDLQRAAVCLIPEAAGHTCADYHFDLTHLR